MGGGEALSLVQGRGQIRRYIKPEYHYLYTAPLQSYYSEVLPTPVQTKITDRWMELQIYGSNGH